MERIQQVKNDSPIFCSFKSYIWIFRVVDSLSDLIKRRNGIKLGLHEPPGATVCAEMSPPSGEEASFINTSRPVKGTVELRLL